MSVYDIKLPSMKDKLREEEIENEKRLLREAKKVKDGGEVEKKPKKKSK